MTCSQTVRYVSLLILFQGNQPMLVAKHLTKLFDSMAKIKMEDETRFSLFSLSVLYLPAFSITAVAMTAKDGEEVAFFKACLCEGQVRRWPGGQVAR